MRYIDELNERISKLTRERDEAITALLDLRAEYTQRAAAAHTYLRLHAAKEHSREVERILTLTDRMRAERDVMRQVAVDPLLTLTAEVVEAGGTGSRKPGITLDLDGKAITLLCTPAQVREVAPHLYRAVTLTLSPAPATVPTDGAGEGVP